MTYVEALQLLSLPPGPQPEKVRSAFFALARIHHPDLGGDSDMFAQLHAAYKLVLLRAEQDSQVCPRCGGIGKVERASRGFYKLRVVCQVCNGTGKRVL